MSSEPDIKIEMKIPIERIRERLGDLDVKAGTVVARVVKRAMTTGKKVIKQETAAKYNVIQRDVEEALKESRDKETRGLIWKLTYQDKHRNLFSFSSGSKTNVVTPKFPVRSSSKYNPDPKFYKANVEKNTGDVELSGSPKPFVQKVPNSGRIALFERVSVNSDAEIRGVAAPAIPQIIKNEKVMKRFDEEVKKTVKKRVDIEIKNILKGR